MNWVKFGLTSAYGVVVFILFFLYIAGYIPTSNLTNDVLDMGFIIMLGIILSMAASASE